MNQLIYETGQQHESSKIPEILSSKEVYLSPTISWEDFIGLSWIFEEE